MSPLGTPGIAPVETRLIKARDVAEMFAVTLRTLFNWERKGILVPCRIVGQRYYRWTDIQSALDGGHGRGQRRVSLRQCNGRYE